jgi:hypothetical protein
MPIASALRFGAHLLHETSRAGGLAGEAVVWWLGRTFTSEARPEFLRTLLDPDNHVHVPIVAVARDGWWFQVTRRIFWVTSATEEQRLVEPLIPGGGDDLRRLVAVEPLLIVARVASQPADWAMAVRVWPSVARPGTRPWSRMAAAIHGHGIPIVTMDPESTSEELEAQLLLLACWYKYLDPDESEFAEAIASAYPRAVGRVLHGTDAPDMPSAAATLLEGLLQPGFDPAMGAVATRRYVSRKATIAILNHRKSAYGGVRPWELLGVTERRYYKLLSRFSPKVGGRYEADAEVIEQMRAHLVNRDRKSEQQRAAMALLQERGFSYAAARKWLQRHSLSEALNARPRPVMPRRPDGGQDRAAREVAP